MAAGAAVMQRRLTRNSLQRDSTLKQKLKSLSKSETSKLGDMASITFSCISLYVCFLSYGMIQEMIYKSPRGVKGEKFTFSIFLVLLQCVANSVVAKLCILWRGDPPSSVPWWKFATISCTFITALFCSQSSLKFINYPIQVLGKSCKMIPVMISGSLFHNKRYVLKQYLAVFSMSLGIAAFMYFRSSSKDDDGTVRWEGIALVLASLVLDGYTGPSQESLLRDFKPTTPQLMLGTNLFAIFVALVVSLVFDSFFPAIQFCLRYPEILWQIGLFCMFSAVGQLFIFMTLVRFDALVLTIITTTRKFFSILASVVYFSHEINTFQWSGVFLVFLGLFVNIHHKYTSKAKQHFN